jgi:hypothetical protein
VSDTQFHGCATADDLENWNGPDYDTDSEDENKCININLILEIETKEKV